VNGGAATLTTMQTQTLTGEARVVISVANGEDRDVYAVTTRGYIVPLFGAPMADNRTPLCPIAQPTCDPVVEDAIAVPACGAQPGRIILRLSTSGPGQLKQMSARGGDLADFPAPVVPASLVELDSAGCVDRFDPSGLTQRQVVTYSMGARNALDEFVPVGTRAVYGCSASGCMHNELLIGAGVTFTEGRMVLSAVDASGVVLVHVVMAPDNVDKDRFVERLRYPAASVPARIVAGTLDADTDSDLFWNIAGRRGSTFEVAYARQVNGAPLEALSPALQGVEVADILIGDLTGSGVDALVFTQATPLAAANAGIVVIPVDAPASIPASKPDSSCN
jgi:hypothetical protein